MRLSIADANKLVVRTLVQNGMPAEDAGIVADHLVDAGMAGHPFASLPRVIALVDQMRRRGPSKRPRVVTETPVSVVIDGGNTNGYVTSVMAIDSATERAKKTGIGVATVHNTWFSGRCSYYVERAARAGLIAIHTANTSARVAPVGTIDRIFGTNPFAVAFPHPATDDPVVVDFTTAATTWGDVLLHLHTDRQLPVGQAVDPNGAPTQNPQEALEGAFLPWGGHRGSGLGLVAQVLGVLAGSDPVISDTGQSGFFFLVLQPSLLGPDGGGLERMEALLTAIGKARPADPVHPPRLPGSRSAARRREAAAAGTIEVDDAIYQKILTLVPPD
ncbi:MAG: malate/L-lactate dehydrogenase family protein [Rhodobacteraceae bacterium HLUCCA12]|nr:MAG: malate/L-lactate dehydrogenase family protein [Rhodobacteraceae bacterium HLUCCA12]